MEYIERIFYRKINPSDFKKLYDIDRPEGGGGQTYLEAAGISNEKIVDFLSYAEVSDSPLKDKGETRSVYNFNAYVLGDAKAGSAFIEFAPRSGRNNYRISRQSTLPGVLLMDFLKQTKMLMEIIHLRGILKV